MGAIKVKVAMADHDNAHSSARKSWGIISNVKEMLFTIFPLLKTLRDKGASVAAILAFIVAWVEKLPCFLGDRVSRLEVCCSTDLSHHPVRRRGGLVR